MNTGQHLKAIDAFQRAAQLEPKEIQHLKNLGVSQMGAGKKEDGIATLKQILLLRPRDHDSLFSLGWLSPHSRYGEAIAH